MIRTGMLKIFVPVALTTLMLAAGTSVGKAETVEVGKQLNFDPIVLTGLSGGSVNSNGCGFIAQAPNHIVTVNVADQIDYMRLILQATGGQPTLLVDGPDGRFCVLAEQFSGGNPEISGVWLPGQYKIYVGDRTGAQHQFELHISQQKNSSQ